MKSSLHGEPDKMKTWWFVRAVTPAQCGSIGANPVLKQVTGTVPSALNTQRTQMAYNRLTFQTQAILVQSSASWLLLYSVFQRGREKWNLMKISQQIGKEKKNQSQETWGTSLIHPCFLYCHPGSLLIDSGMCQVLPCFRATGLVTSTWSSFPSQCMDPSQLLNIG